MGFGVQIFSVDWPYITSRVGSRDHYILERVRPDLMDVWDPADFEPDEVMPPEALDRLLEGRVPKGEGGGDAYYIAVLGIYRRFGLFVGNLALASDGIAFLKAVEDALTTAGAKEPLNLANLLYRGVPFELPDGDEPSLGYLSPREVCRGLQDLWRHFDSRYAP